MCGQERTRHSRLTLNVNAPLWGDRRSGDVPNQRTWRAPASADCGLRATGGSSAAGLEPPCRRTLDRICSVDMLAAHWQKV